VENRVASIVDLVEVLSSPGRVLDALGVVSDHVFRKCPKKCYDCENERFETLELVGVSNKPLFFECLACGALHLKYNREWVEKQFKSLKGLWTNPLDWEEQDPESYN